MVQKAIVYLLSHVLSTSRVVCAHHLLAHFQAEQDLSALTVMRALLGPLHSAALNGRDSGSQI